MLHSLARVINIIIFIFTIFIPITIVHELLHAIAYKIFGGKVRFGFKGIYAYTQEISERAFHRSAFLFILLAPVVFISLVSLLLPSSIGGLIFILNLLGSTGDLYMAFYLCRLKSNSYIIDKIYGFDIIN